MKLFTAIILLSLISTAFSETTYRKRIHQLQKTVSAADIAAEISFGRNLSASILTQYPYYDHAQINKYISTLGSMLVSYVGRPEIKYHFAVISSKDINAYATPSGHIFITLESIKQMKNEAQLAGVLLHEIAHVNNKHIVKELNIKAKDDSLASNLSSVIQGANILNALDQSATLLLKKGMKQDDEYEADLDTIDSMLALGYSPFEYYSYLFNINKASEKNSLPVGNLATTHPPLEQRLSRIIDRMKHHRISKNWGSKHATRFKKNYTM